MSDAPYLAEPQSATRRDPYELMRIFEGAEDLPTLPEVAVHLQEVVDDPHSGAREVARIIQDDPAIATRVLRVVNSVFYKPGRGAEITELHRAVARLGFLTVTNIALSTSIFRAFGRVQQPAFDRREFWRHSVSVGIVASVLHDQCDLAGEARVTRDAAHLAGIVHDMGKILFERYANAEFHEAIHSAREGDLPIVKEEERFLGMGHDAAGAWLASEWKIDKPIEAVVRWHHDPLSCPEVEYQGLAKLVHTADYLCHRQALGDSGNPNPTFDSRVLEELELTEEKIAQLMPVIEIESANSEILLSLAD